MASTSSAAPESQPLLETVKYLQQYGPGKLQSEYRLSSKQHSKHKNLWLFKYSQTQSDFAEQIVRECRGLILDERAKWKVVSFPYLKFFNYGEENAAEIDWSTAKVYDKVDGSLATLYFYKGEWNVSSSGTPDASGSMPNSPSFAEIFWQLWSKLKYKMPTDTSKCYMFEMFARKQRIIVPVNDEMIFLHGVRDLQTLEEVDPEPFAAKLGYKMPTSFPLTTIDEVLEASKKLTPDIAEGFVVVDAHFNRIKIKSPVYVAVAHLNKNDPSNLNYRSMLNIIRTNESSEFLTYFPQWKALHTNVFRNYRALMADISDLWDACKNSGAHDSESFGLAATKFLATKKWPNSEVYFNIVKRIQGGLYPSVLAFMQQCDIKILLVLVERFGVKVLHTDFVKVKHKQPPAQQSKAATKVVKHFIQGPPKEPVFDDTASSSSAPTKPADPPLTDALEQIVLGTDTKGGKKSKKGGKAAGGRGTVVKGPSKAELARAAEEAELQAFLAKLNDRANGADDDNEE